MTTSLVQNVSKQMVLALCCSLVLFAGSAFQAHAATESETMSLMQSQLNAVSDYLATVHSVRVAPKAAVLGASITLSSDQVQSQIDEVTNQINALTGQPTGQDQKGKGLKGKFELKQTASSTPVRPGCALIAKMGKSESANASSTDGGKGKGGDCRGNELARLLAAQKEVAARIAELQAKAVQIKARIAEILSTTGSGTVKGTVRFVPPFGKGEKNHTSSSTSSTGVPATSPTI